MPRFEFQGHSDDTFGEYGVTMDDYDNCASGKPIEWLITTGEESMLVVGQYCPGAATGWLIGVARADEDDDKPLPSWPVSIVQSSAEDRLPYSPTLIVDAPAVAMIRCLQRDDGDD